MVEATVAEAAATVSSKKHKAGAATAKVKQKKNKDKVGLGKVVLTQWHQGENKVIVTEEQKGREGGG